MVLDPFIIRLVAAAVSFAVAFIASGYIRSIIKEFLIKFGDEFASKVSEIVRYFTIILGVIVAFSILSLDVMVISIIIGILFIFMLVSSRDILLNFAAEIYLRVRKPFDKGDWIRIEGVEGRVREIGSIDTEIITSEGERVIIPNYLFLRTPVINKSKAIATYVEIKLTFEKLPLSKLETAVMNALNEIRSELLGEPEILSITESDEKAEIIVSLPVVNLKKLRWLINRISKSFYRQGIEVEIE